MYVHIWLSLPTTLGISAKAKRCGSWPQTRRTWRSKHWSCRRLHFWAQWLEKLWKWLGTCCSPPVRLEHVRFYVRWGSLEDSKLFLKLSKVAPAHECVNDTFGWENWEFDRFTPLYLVCCEKP